LPPEKAAGQAAVSISDYNRAGLKKQEGYLAFQRFSCAYKGV